MCTLGYFCIQTSSSWTRHPLTPSLKLFLRLVITYQARPTRQCCCIHVMLKGIPLLLSKEKQCSSETRYLLLDQLLVVFFSSVVDLQGTGIARIQPVPVRVAFDVVLFNPHLNDRLFVNSDAPGTHPVLLVAVHVVVVHSKVAARVGQLDTATVCRGP